MPVGDAVTANANEVAETIAPVVTEAVANASSDPAWLQVLQVVGPAAASIIVILYLLRPVVKALIAKLGDLPTPDQLSALHGQTEGNVMREVRAEGKMTRETTNGLTRAVDRLTEAIEKREESQTSLAAEIKALPDRLALNVGRAIRDRAYLKALEEYEKKVRALEARLDLSSDPEDRRQAEKELTHLRANPPSAI